MPGVLTISSYFSLPGDTLTKIRSIFFFKTWRVEKSYWQSPVLSKESVEQQCILGLEQAGDTVMPQIELRHFFKPFIEDEVPNLIKNSLAFVSHPDSKKQLPKNRSHTHVCVAIGSEGGFIEYEIRMLVQKGFEPVTLGKRIQRVEWAIPFILGRLF